ncbi:MAG: hypothetical protein R3B37_13640 [Nitrospira sp.]|nr:hypothetical protein [Nitrospira sp.]
MQYPVMSLWCIPLILGGLLSPVAAETSQERVALSLSGPDCFSQYRSIGAALARISGVKQVDLGSVPDHALVDVVHGLATSEVLLEAAARGIEPGARCQVDIMKSCISASPAPSHH